MIKLYCWLDEDGVLREAGPFAPRERIVPILSVEDDTVEDVAERVALIYAELEIPL